MHRGGKRNKYAAFSNIDGELLIPGALEDHMCALAQESEPGKGQCPVSY